ncbi:MAG: hypothetical protein QOF81_904, partial [Acidimicrobiaceae bacterium]|nr:hypothetical protein [Acidimicrobiaceae bacterium]
DQHLCGARERNRTADLRITSALLYRLSYSGGATIVSQVPRPPTPLWSTDTVTVGW